MVVTLKNVAQKVVSSLEGATTRTLIVMNVLKKRIVSEKLIEYFASFRKAMPSLARNSLSQFSKSAPIVMDRLRCKFNREQLNYYLDSTCTWVVGNRKKSTLFALAIICVSYYITAQNAALDAAEKARNAAEEIVDQEIEQAQIMQKTIERLKGEIKSNADISNRESKNMTKTQCMNSFDSCYSGCGSPHGDVNSASMKSWANCSVSCQNIKNRCNAM